MLTRADAETFSRSISVGGVVVFPADTVYGLACEPDTPEAVRRLQGLKRRSAAQPSAVMFFALDLLLEALPELGDRTRAVAEALLPGGVTLLVANPLGRFPLACASRPDVLGVRVPALGDALAPLGAMRWPVLATSANLHGGPDPRSLEEVPEALRTEADLLLDGGPLAGTPSTVVDLSRYEATGSWGIVREGAVSAAVVERATGAPPTLEG